MEGMYYGKETDWGLFLSPQERITRSLVCSSSSSKRNFQFPTCAIQGWRNAGRTPGCWFSSLPNSSAAHTFGRSWLATVKAPLRARANHVSERRLLEIVSGQECVTLSRPSLVNKDGSGLARSPRSAGSRPEGLTSSPRTPGVRLGSLAPPCPWQPLGQPPATWRRDAELIWAAWRSPKLRKLSKAQWLLPPGWAGCGVGGRAAKQIKPREPTGGDRTRTGVSSHLRLRRLAGDSSAAKPPSPEPQRGPGRTGPLAHLLSLPGASRPFRGPGAALTPASPPQLRPGRWAPRWRRRASRCAAPGPWSPARSSVSRATARPRCPWSSCWTSVSGARARRGRGSCLRFQTRHRQDALA